MKLSITKITVLISLSVNVVLIGIAFVQHSGIRKEVSSFDTRELVLFIFMSVIMTLIACWPWLAALASLNENRTTSSIVFSIIATISVVIFFIPSPITPVEALGYYVVCHLFVVWLAYPFSLIFKNEEQASNKLLHTDAQKDARP